MWHSLVSVKLSPLIPPFFLSLLSILLPNSFPPSYHFPSPSSPPPPLPPPPLPLLLLLLYLPLPPLILSYYYSKISQCCLSNYRYSIEQTKGREWMPHLILLPISFPPSCPPPPSYPSLFLHYRKQANAPSQPIARAWNRQKVGNGCHTE